MTCTDEHNHTLCTAASSPFRSSYSCHDLFICMLCCIIAMLLLVPHIMQYSWPAGLFVLGFVAFPMPEIFPKHYWLFHSLWHVLLAAGYYELYALIEFDSNTVYKKAQRHKHVRAKKQTGQLLKQGVTVSEADKLGPSQVSSALLNPKTYITIQKCHPYISKLNSEMAGDSKKAFPHGGDV